MIPSTTGATQPPLQANRVYVGNLSEDIRPAHLYSHFVGCGRILTIQKKYSKYAFVEFSTIESAETAIGELNGSILRNHKIVVNKIFSDEEKKLRITVKTADVVSENGEIQREPLESYVGENSVYKEELEEKCKVVIESGKIRHFGETIRDQLIALGIKSSLFVMSRSLNLNMVLGNFQNESLDVVVLINKLNMMMESMSVIFLQGNAIKHENVPINDGLRLVFKHLKIVSQNSIIYQHPAYVRRFIMENDSLTVNQLDSLIGYLKERREEQKKVEVGDDETFNKMKNLKSFKEEEKNKLQQQIYEILTQQSEERREANAGKLTEEERKALVEEMKKNAKVQKAIQNFRESKKSIQ